MSYFFGFVLLFKKGEVFDNGEHVYKSFKADVTHVPPIDDFPQRDGAVNHDLNELIFHQFISKHDTFRFS